MGRGLGPTQRMVLDYLQERWASPTDPYFVGVGQDMVAADLAATHSEAQAIRRAIRTLKDRKLIGTAYLMNEHQCALVPVGENAFSTEPRPRETRQLEGLREAILQQLTHDWAAVPDVRDAVIGEEPHPVLVDGVFVWPDGEVSRWHHWSKQRTLFNRALRQLVRGLLATSVGSTRSSHRQNDWQARLLTDQERQQLQRFKR